MKENINGEKADESNSILTQKMILLQYAKQNHFPNPTFFVDDGYSGVKPDTSSEKRRQKIHIEYDGIGFIPLEELAKKETA